jgi:putative two-component system response regulator
VLQLAAEVSMAHHEHFSGAGYPQGLVGEAIPLSGRIVALADFFDTLSIDRCYRKAHPTRRSWR